MRRVIKKPAAEVINPYEFLDMQTYKYYPRSLLEAEEAERLAQEEGYRDSNDLEGAPINWEQKKIDYEEVKRLAQKEAKQYIAEASALIEEEKSKVLEEAQEEGYQVGWKVAQIENQKVLEEEREKIQVEVAKQIAELEEEKQRIVEKYIEELTDLAISVAEKIVKISLRSNSEVVKKVILAAVGKLKKTAWIKLYVGKSEVGHQLEADNDFLESIARIADQVKIIYIDDQDANLIETPEGVIDLSTKSQIETIKNIIHESRG